MADAAFRDAFDIARALTHGGQALKLAPVPLMVGAFLMMITDGGSGGGGNFSGGGGGWPGSGHGKHDHKDILLDAGQGLLHAAGDGLHAGRAFFLGSGMPGGAELAIIALVVAIVGVIFLGLFALRCFIHTGWLRLHLEILERGEGVFGTLFGGADRIGTMAGWKILKTIIVLGVMGFTLAPGAGVAIWGGTQENWILVAVGVGIALLLLVPILLYVALGLAFGEHFIALEGLGTMESLERSWGMARGNRVHLALFMFVMGMVNLLAAVAGLLLCCVGLLVTVPAARSVIDVGMTESWLLYNRSKETTESWEIWKLATPA